MTYEEEGCRVMELQGSRLVLRQWSANDAQSLLEAFSDPEVMQYWDSPAMQSLGELEAYISRSISVPINRHCAYVVELRETGEITGFVNYHHRETTNRRLELGYLMKRRYWRKGLAREAMQVLIEHCFDELDTYRIEATVSPGNDASMGLLRSLGFICEGGPMRARLWTSDGRKLDAFMFGLLAPDWQRGGT